MLLSQLRAHFQVGGDAQAWRRTLQGGCDAQAQQEVLHKAGGLQPQEEHSVGRCAQVQRQAHYYVGGVPKHSSRGTEDYAPLLTVRLQHLQQKRTCGLCSQIAKTHLW